VSTSPGPSYLTLGPSIPLGAYARGGCVAALLNSGLARNPSFSVNRSLPLSWGDSNEFQRWMKTRTMRW